jgi:hypothetical protein
MRTFLVDMRCPGLPELKLKVLAESSHSALLWALNEHPKYTGRCAVYVRPAR